VVSLEDSGCRCRPLERLQYEWQRGHSWANLGSRSSHCKIHYEWILLSPSIILALFSLISVSSWGITGRRNKNKNRSNRFNLVKVAVIALSVAAVIVAFVSSSLVLTTAVLIVSIASNVGLAIWDFVNQIRPSSAEEALSR